MIASYSFLRDLENCPHKAYRKYLVRDLPKEDSPELREGIIIHKIFEDYINGASGRLPVELESHAKPLTARGAQAEVMLGMTKDCQPAPFWNSPSDDVPEGSPPVEKLWLRGKVDVLVLEPPVAFIVDWKTGKVREDPHELRVQALLVRANYPTVHRIRGCYVWLKTGCAGPIYDLSDLNATYHETIAALETAESYGADWPTKPNALCNWCPVGDCRFNSNPRLIK